MNFSVFTIALTFFASLAASKPVFENADTLDLFTADMGDGHFANVDVDGVETLAPKKTEKLPGQKKMKAEFQQPEGIAPEFTGKFDEKPEVSSEDYVESVPVANPAMTYLAGAVFDEQPKCQMLGCTGPIPNDGSYSAMSASLDDKACSQVFVAMNGCTDNKGYPMGMLCSVCCDCANSFVAEMKKTFGYKAGIETAVFSQ